LSETGPAEIPVRFKLTVAGNMLIGGNHTRIDVPAAATIHQGLWSQNTATAETFTLYKNGASTGSTITAPGGAQEHGADLWSAPVSYALGDDIGINKSAALTSSMVVSIEAGLTGITYSGSLNDNEFAFVGQTNFAQGAGLQPNESETVVPFDCSYIGVIHNQDNSGGGREIEVYINGILSQGVNVNANRGFLPFTETAISAGDELALMADVGSSGSTHWILVIKSRYTGFQFGGNNNANDNNLEPLAQYSEILPNGVDPDPEHQFFLPNTCRVAFLSWSATANSSLDLELRYSSDDNVSDLGAGTLVHTFVGPVTTNQGFVDVRPANVILSGGGRMALKNSNSFSTGQGTFTIWVENIDRV
jgi:hypothetical protein